MSDVERCLAALYAQVPAVVADDVKRIVMAEIERLRAELTAKDAVVEAAREHAKDCWRCGPLEDALRALNAAKRGDGE